MQTYTTGPWTVDESNDGEHKRVTVITPRYDKPGSYIIADCGRFENHAAQANARLIAAAPALYGALAHAVGITENFANSPSFKGRMERWLDDAIAALAIADGNEGGA